MKSLKITDAELLSYPERKIRPISKSFGDINFVGGKNGRGKTTLADALKHILWKDVSKKDRFNPLRMDIRGKGVLDGKEISFATKDKEKPEDIWDDNVFSPENIMYDLNIDDLLKYNFSDYKDMRSKIGVGNINLETKKFSFQFKTECEKVFDDIKKIRSKKTESENIKSRSDEKKLLIEKNTEKIKELEEKKILGEKTEKLALCEKEIAKLENKIKTEFAGEEKILAALKEKPQTATEIISHSSALASEKKALSSVTVPDYDGIEFKEGEDYSPVIGFCPENRAEWDFAENFAKTEETRKKEIAEKENQIKICEEIIKTNYKEADRFWSEGKKKADLPTKKILLDSLFASYRKKASENFISDIKEISPLFFIIGICLLFAFFVIGTVAEKHISFVSLLSLAVAVYLFFRIKNYNNSLNKIREENEKCQDIANAEETLWQIYDIDRYAQTLEEKNRFACEAKILTEAFQKDRERAEELKNRYISLLRNYNVFEKYLGYDIFILRNKTENDYKDWMQVRRAKEKIRQISDSIKEKENTLSALFAEIGVGNYEEFQKINAKLGIYSDTLKEKEMKEKEFSDNFFPEYNTMTEEEKKEISDSRTYDSEINSLYKANASLANEVREMEEVSSDSLLAEETEKKAFLAEKIRDNMKTLAKNTILRYIRKENDNFTSDIKDRAVDYFNKFAKGKYIMDQNEKITGTNESDVFKEGNFSSLSRGTKCQLILAAKLALLDSAEKDIRYPLFLDESLASCDDESTKAVIEALAEIKDRQIFYFSPKSYAQKEWEDVLGDRLEVIDLNV